MRTFSITQPQQTHQLHSKDIHPLTTMPRFHKHPVVKSYKQQHLGSAGFNYKWGNGNKMVVIPLDFGTTEEEKGPVEEVRFICKRCEKLLKLSGYRHFCNAVPDAELNDLTDTPEEKEEEKVKAEEQQKKRAKEE